MAIDNTAKYGMFTQRLPNMSPRDWFAGMAMQGMLSRDLVHDGASNYSARWANVAKDNDHGLPRRAYAIADAMMLEREGGHESNR